MTWEKLTLWGLRCLRCEHVWVPRGIDQEINDSKPPADPTPQLRVRMCPKCKSALWYVAKGTKEGLAAPPDKGKGGGRGSVTRPSRTGK